MSKPFKELKQVRLYPQKQGLFFGTDRANYQIYVRYDISLRDREKDILLKLAQSLASATITGIYNEDGEEIYVVDDKGYAQEWNEYEPFDEGNDTE